MKPQYIILLGGPLSGTILEFPEEQEKVDVIAMEWRTPPKLMYENTDRGQMIEVPNGYTVSASVYQIN